MVFRDLLMGFPINRCNQRVVTQITEGNMEPHSPAFPINRCHQRVVTSEHYEPIQQRRPLFPINRCHQRVVTRLRIDAVIRGPLVSNQ